jgi:hypothetical protein
LCVSFRVEKFVSFRADAKQNERKMPPKVAFLRKKGTNVEVKSVKVAGNQVNLFMTT